MNQLQTQKDPWYVIRIQESKILDYVFAFLFAILPIVQPLKTFLPVTWSMAILIVSVPYIGLKFLAAGELKLTHTWPMWLYCGYRILNHGTNFSELLSLLFIIALYIALFNRFIDVDFFYKVVIAISLFATTLIILQTLCYYIFDFHLKILPPSLLRTPEMRIEYDKILRTGISDGLYRPSAFFIEPSGISQYSLPALFYLMVDKYKEPGNIKKAILISIGLVISTSGMGIAIAGSFWLFYCFRRLIVNRKLNIKTLIIIILLVLFLILLILVVPFLNSAVSRVFVESKGTNNAIDGRFEAGDRYYNSLNLSGKILGTGKETNEFELYVAGMHYIILVDGIIGYALYCLVYIHYGFVVKNKYRYLALALIGLSILANIVYIQSYIYYLVALGMGINRFYDKLNMYIENNLIEK